MNFISEWCWECSHAGALMQVWPVWSTSMLYVDAVWLQAMFGSCCTDSLDSCLLVCELSWQRNPTLSLVVWSQVHQGAASPRVSCISAALRHSLLNQSVFMLIKTTARLSGVEIIICCSPIILCHIQTVPGEVSDADSPQMFVWELLYLSICRFSEDLRNRLHNLVSYNVEGRLCL